jgi:hypothetical protein
VTQDPLGAREELRQRIAAAIPAELIATPHLAGDLTRREIAEAVAKLFYTVEDEWQRMDITTLGEAGRKESWIDNRFLVARMPVQGVAGERKIDRTVP